MEYIIQQITQELLTKITEKALNGGIHDIDALASDVLTDCKSAASRMIEAICHDINLRIRGDKEGRQMHGLLLKENLLRKVNKFFLAGFCILLHHKQADIVGLEDVCRCSMSILRLLSHSIF